MKSQKITSFSAHNKTTCLQIGQKSGRVLVTGGQDRIVNLWAIGKTQSILSLTGHVTSIESVSLDYAEELVVAGSAGGSLKLWDLAEAKVIRTLAGHRSAIESVEFHPFGEFFASGSSDQSLRLWDVRKKSCIQTYHGHGDTINTIKMSPDGRWIASGSYDGTVKIWDMTAGKLLTTLSDAADHITSVCFNPCDFFLSSASLDGTVRIYDLQDFSLITQAQVNNPDRVFFSPDGQHLLVSCDDSLGVYHWDPLTLVSSKEVQWHPIKSLGFLPESNKVISCSTNGTIVDVIGFRLDVTSPDGQRSEDRSNSPFVEVIESVPSLPPKQKDPVQSLTNATEKLKINNDEPVPMNRAFNDTSIEQATPSKNLFRYIPAADGNKPLNLDLTTFLKGVPRGQTKMLVGNGSETISTTLDAFESMLFRHGSVQGILNTKLFHLQTIRDLWSEESIIPALTALTEIGDSSVVVDILRIINCKPKLITLEAATLILPLLSELLFAIYEEYFNLISYIVVACQTLKILSKSFGQLIQTTLSFADTKKPMDLSLEDRLIDLIRLLKCTICRDEFMNAFSILAEMKASGSVGVLLRETIQELKAFQ